MILLADNWGPDYTARNAQADMDLRCPHMPEDTFLHGTAQIIECLLWAFVHDMNTDNPLYTDTRYNDKVRYNYNFTVIKPSLKR